MVGPKPIKRLYVAFLFIVNIDENVVQICNNGKVELFCKNLINVALESGWYISQSKRYYLVFEIVIGGS